MSGTDYLVEILTDFCENPPVVSRSESGSTINCLWLPSELNHEWELRFSCTIVTRGGCDVVMSIDFSAPSSVQKVEDFLAELRDRVNLPFYLMTIDHARMFVKRTIWREMEEEGWVEPPTWSCPVTYKDRGCAGASGVAAHSADCSEFSDKRYLKHIEWLDIPPSFPGTVTRGKHAGFANHISVKVFLNDLKDINRCNDMRCYFDEGDMTNCILKASPHLIFRVFAKDADAQPKALCQSLDQMNLLGLEYHLRFPSDYPDSPPLVRVYRPHLQGGFVLPSGAVCTEALQPSSWRAKHSFEGVFRGIFFLQGFAGLIASSDRVYSDEAEAHKTTFEWLAQVHSEWQSKKK